MHHTIGTAELTGKYVRKCKHCNREFIDHIHTKHHRKVFCLTFILWFPLAVAYCLFCVACCAFCWPFVQFGEMEIESNETTYNDSKDNLAHVSNKSRSLEKRNDDDDIVANKHVVKQTCYNTFKLVMSIILFPFILVSQFAHLFDCDVSFPPIFYFPGLIPFFLYNF